MGSGAPKSLLADLERRQKLFVLVHGTWANKATWIEQSSYFASRLTAIVPCSETRAFRWTGANRDKARRQAALQLAEFTSKLREDHADAEIVVVGHSHGGNVALAAYGEPKGRQSIDRVVCLGTPFFHFRPRELKPAAYVIATGVLALLCFAIVLGRAHQLWTSMVVPTVSSSPNERIDEVTGLPEFNEDEYSKFLGASMWAFYSLMFFAALPPLLFVLIKPLAWLCEKVLKKLQRNWLERHTTGLSSCPPTLVFFTEKDEARRWLWFIERVWRPVFTALFVGGQILTKVLIIAIPLAFVAIRRSLSENNSDQLFPYFGAFGNVLLLIGITYVFTLGALGLSFLAAVYGRFIAGTPWGFGSAGLISYQLIAVKAVRLPSTLQNVEAQSVDFNSRSIGRGLRHSMFYANDEVIERVCQWLSGAHFSAQALQTESEVDHPRLYAARTQWLYAILVLIGSWLLWRLI
jgi:pimeloyl-ACP methyl ester carboxylesterase